LVALQSFLGKYPNLAKNESAIQKKTAHVIIT
jgi:hypothetical protein